MKADTSHSPAKFADTMPYAYSIVKTQKAGARAPFGNLHTSRAITYLWLVLARLIVKGYSCARKATVVE